MTRLAIHHMSALERPHAEIAAAVTRTSSEAVSTRSVRRILSEPVPTLSAIAERGPGRPSTVEAWRERVATELEREGDLSTTELLRRARDWGYGGKKCIALLRAAARLTSHPAIDADAPRVEATGVGHGPG